MSSGERPLRSVRFDRTTVTIKGQIRAPNIYKCCDIRGKDYALKVESCSTTEDLFKRKQEFRIQSRLSTDQNIVSAFGFTEDKDAGVSYLLYEYCPSQLIEKWESMGEFSPKRVVDFIQGICCALFFMHKQNPPVIHRNLTPDNIFFLRGLWKVGNFESATESPFTAFNDPARVRLMRQEIESVTDAAFRAPEMIDFTMKRSIGPKVDIWALGCVVFRLCAGRNAFSGSPEDITSLKYEWPVDLEIDNRIKEAVRCMLTVDPDLRPSVPMLLARLHSLFPEWVDKRWAIQKPIVQMAKRELGFTMRPYVTGTPGLPTAGRDLKVVARQRGMKQYQSDAAFDAESKSNRHAGDFSGCDALQAKFLTAVPQLRAVGRQRPKPCTLQPPEQRAEMSGIPPPPRKDRAPSPEKEGKSRRRRRKVDGEPCESLVADIVGDPDCEEEAADCAQKNIDLMVKEPSLLVKELRRVTDDDVMRHRLDMLFQSSERVCYGFFYTLLHGVKEPIRVLRNTPKVTNACFEDCWNTRKEFAEKFPMFEGNFKLDRFTQKCQEKHAFPAVGQPPICMDALEDLQEYAVKVITLSHEVAERSIAEEVKLTYNAVCQLTATLLAANIETDRLTTDIVPRVNGLHQPVYQSLTSYGMQFPATPYDLTKMELFVTK